MTRASAPVPMHVEHIHHMPGSLLLVFFICFVFYGPWGIRAYL